MDSNTLLVTLVSCAGLGVGYLLALLSPEEMKPGKKYFLVLEKALRILVFVPVLFFSAVYDYWLVLFAALLLVSFFLSLRERSVLLYVAFVLMIFLTQESSVYLTQASFVFLYGLTAGTLLRITHTRNRALVSRRNARTG